MTATIRTIAICLAAAVLLAPRLLSAEPDAQNTTETKVDPIVGRWNPTNTDIPITLHSNGSASDRSRKGKWECLTPDVTPRTYRITWERFLDTLLLIKGGKELIGENRDGLELRWIRLPAAASDAARESAAARDAAREPAAASAIAPEFDQLTLARDKELATAVEPINRVYQKALETLQQRATQANDLDTANRIKEALDKLSAKTEILGTWDFVNHADGVKYVAGFKADHTYFWDGKEVGMWHTQGKAITITHYNRGGHSDYYRLPVRDGKLDGSNTRGDKVTITRKPE